MITKDLEKQIIDKMEERNYNYLFKSTGVKFVDYAFHTPLEDKVKFCVDVIVREENDVTFKFRKSIDVIFTVTSDEIGSLFDDEHFNKFESRFLAVANWCQCYDRNIGK